jgi:hypothetical protein
MSLRDLQSIGRGNRGIKPGEVNVIAYGGRAEYWFHVAHTGEWFYSTNTRGDNYMLTMMSDRIVVKHEGDPYKWYKSRAGRTGDLTEDELRDMLFAILGATPV